MGSGGHSAAVIELARSAGFDVAGYTSPHAAPAGLLDCTYLGGDDVLETMNRKTVKIAIGIGSVGSPDVRQRIFARANDMGFDLPVLKHASSWVAPSAVVGEATQVLAGGIVQACARVGANVIINSGAIVEHHAVIGDHVHVAPGAVICGDVEIGSGCHIGANATILQGLSIGSGTIVGAGAVVTRNTPGGSTVKGSPAR